MTADSPFYVQSNEGMERARLVAVLAAFLSVLLAALFGLLQFQDIQAGKQSIRAIEENAHRHRMIAQYLGVLQDIETGQRGYVVTGNPEFLTPARQATRRAAPIEEALLVAYPSASRAAAVGRELVKVGRAKRSVAEGIINLRQTEGAQMASAAVSAGKGKRLMDRARALVAILERVEGERERKILVDAADLRQLQQNRILLIEMALLISIAALVAAMLQTIAALGRSSSALAEAADRQATIFDAATDAMLILNADGVVTSANKAAETLFGKATGEMVARSNLELFADPPAEAQSQAYLRAIARRDGSAETLQYFVGRRSDGTTFETEVATTPVVLNDQNHFLAVARDITERRRVERLKSEFVATVSHELRTPLTSIAGALGLLAGGAGGVLPDKAGRLLEIARNNSQRLIRLINDILDIEKIESGKMRFAPQIIALDHFLAQAADAISGAAAEREVSVRLAAVAPDSTIYADPDRMNQVMANLLSNAIKYSPVGGLVTISTATYGLYQRISVADKGSGIPDEFRSRIFGKFAQADSTDTRLVGGTGLGLSIVREIVGRSGGSISFESRVGEGTVFHVDMPRPTIISGEPPDRKDLARPPGQSVLHILHVDDDPDTLRLVASTLNERCDVHSTPSLHEAHAALRRFRFDLVILDVSMSDGSGLDLIPAVRSSSASCPVILYTAQDIDPTDAAKVDAVLIKSRERLEDLVTLVDRFANAAVEQPPA